MTTHLASSGDRAACGVSLTRPSAKYSVVARDVTCRRCKSTHSQQVQALTGRSPAALRLVR